MAARHPSAAGGVVAIAAAARRRHLGVEVLASGPALSSLTARRMRHVYSFDTVRRRYPALPIFTGPERIEREEWARPTRARRLVEEMVTWLTGYLAASRPSAVLLTDATEQIGADQLLAIAASRAKIPCVRVRDAWGTGEGVETRAWRGRLPDQMRAEALATRYLEIDDQGVELSARRLGIPRDRLRAVQGLYTLDRLVGRATAARRARARRRIGVGQQEPLVVFFVQPTHRERAEVEALDAFVAAMNTAGLGARSVTLATQEHPREGDPADGRLGLHWAAARAAAAYSGRVINLTPLVIERGAVTFEDTMVAADVFASSYSNASIEATVLGASSAGLRADERPIGFHTLCPGAVRRTMRATRAGMTIMPFATQGALPYATRPADIGPAVTRLLFRPASREAHYRILRRRWHLGASTERVIDEVLELVNQA